MNRPVCQRKDLQCETMFARPQIVATVKNQMLPRRECERASSRVLKHLVSQSPDKGYYDHT